MALPFDWALIDPFPVDSVAPYFAWSPTLEIGVIISNADVYYTEDGIEFQIGTPPSVTHGIEFPIWNAALSAFYGIVYNSGAAAYWSAKSVDGITWSYDSALTASAVEFTGLACSGSGAMIAITADGHCFRGTGSGWTEASSTLITIDADVNTRWLAPIWHAGGSVWAVFNFGTGHGTDIPIATSPDAVTWTGRHGFEPVFQQDWKFATAYPSGGLAISLTNGVIITSADGITWTLETDIDAEFPSLNVEINGLLYSADLNKFIVFNWDFPNDETKVLVSETGEAGDWAEDSGVIPTATDGFDDENMWVGPFEAPELERFYGLAGTNGVLTPVVTSPGLDGGGGGGEDIILELDDEITGGLEMSGEADVTVGWSYTGSGGLEIGGDQTQMVLPVDSSGIYTFVSEQRFDRIYTRDTDPDDTTDVKIPDPFAKTAYIGF